MSYTNLNCTYRRNKILLPPGARLSSLFTPTASQKFALGTILEADDATGRMWRYCKAGTEPLTRAFMNASEAPSANGLEIEQTAYSHSVGDMLFNILLTTSHGYSDHELIDGLLYINKSATAGSTVGDYYIIKDNKIITNDTVMQIELADEGGLRTAISGTTTADEISLIKSPYRDVVVNPTSQAAMVVGVNNVDVTASYYFWGQYRGPCALIVDDGDTVVIGEPIGKAGTAGTAGAGGLIANDGTDCTWGTVMTVGAGGEPSLVMLNLP